MVSPPWANKKQEVTMKLGKAIEILKDIKNTRVYLGEPDDSEAVQLGIEALKEVTRARYGDPALDGELLPSETE